MLDALIQGLFIGIGIMLSFVGFVVVIYFIVKRRMSQGAEDVFTVALFEAYLEECLDKEDYLEAEQAREIIQALENDEMTALLDNYQVEAENFLIINSEDGEDQIRIGETQRIVRRR